MHIGDKKVLRFLAVVWSNELPPRKYVDILEIRGKTQNFVMVNISSLQDILLIIKTKVRVDLFAKPEKEFGLSWDEPRA